MNKKQTTEERLRSERDHAQDELGKILALYARHFTDPAIDECPDLGAYLDGHTDLKLPEKIEGIFIELKSLRKENERHVHGVPLESDFICPNELESYELKKTIGRIRRKIADLKTIHEHDYLPDVAEDLATALEEEVAGPFWYAGTPDFAHMGPYESQVAAWNAVTGHDGLPVEGARVWCTDKRLEHPRRAG